MIMGLCDPPGYAIGIDPGVNFGVTVLDGAIATVIWGRLPKQAHRYMYGSWAVEVSNALAELTVSKLSSPRWGVVEDAAFNKSMGQVGLAEVRFGFFYGLSKWMLHVDLMPPMSVRKLVFGDGRTQAMDVWPLLNHNAADSVAIAIATQMRKEQYEQANSNS